MTEAAKTVFAEIVPDPTSAARISVFVNDLPDAHGDAGLLQRVWLNLLSNAVKFSAGREKPEIHVEGSVEGGEVVYRVRDNGVGFDMKYVDKLFDVFHRLHGMNEFEGTGVGLAKVRRIVVRHGGRVWADGELDRGATFSFSLPVKARSDISMSWKKLVLPPGTTNIP
jgi:light-regulated signal transduction histidine kinase (bacteriophytochrome)